MLNQLPEKTLTLDAISENLHQLIQRMITALNLKLNQFEIEHLVSVYRTRNQIPTETELMMFAQINSEHCRHKIFNASWSINNRQQELSLFDMIRYTMQQNPNQVRVAYDDNAAVLNGHQHTHWLQPDPTDHQYRSHTEPSHIVFKVETHNHPTAISPYAGAATGSGGEIRDEAATGRGAETKAGLSGFMTGHLNIPNLSQAWENNLPKPPHLASALDIMLEGPIGSSRFNNEFGRPCLTGIFRTFENSIPRKVGKDIRSYYKPIMIAGGIGSIRESQITKQPIPAGAQLIVLGGPAMRIGLGGGSASSTSNTDTNTTLDFASVQRANPQMQRKVQEVINTCWQMGQNNPIISIHDVGAGGLCNALPELIYADKLGGQFDLKRIPCSQSNLSAMEIWCNEAQERYVLAVLDSDIELFADICQREQCPYAIVGIATSEPTLKLSDDNKQTLQAINLPMAALFEDMPALECTVSRTPFGQCNFTTTGLLIDEVIERVLQFPAVADKSFLITIGDRSVGGLVARDQMVGPWQIPVSDVAVTHSDFQGYTGEAMAMGERTPIACLHPAASARMAIGEALTNLIAAPIKKLNDISLSANWMAACDYSSDAADLYDAVQAVGTELCPALGINIPVGKDSLSMKVEWQDNEEKHIVASPVSLIVTAAAAVNDVRETLTPELHPEQETCLIFIDLANGAQCLGGTSLAQVYQKLGQRPADIDSPEIFKKGLEAIIEAKNKQLLLAYHDRSDGGLFVTLAEMAFASRCGLEVDISNLGADPIKILFNEELGVVIEVAKHELIRVQAIFKNHDVLDLFHPIGKPQKFQTLQIKHNNLTVVNHSRSHLQRLWSSTSYHMQALRDHTGLAQQAYDTILDNDDPGLNSVITFDPNEKISAPFLNLTPPRIAILREQGTNGHREMAAAFHRSGFQCHDIHMTDLNRGKTSLSDYHGLVACGGFSYGDALGAGRGWAQTILHNQQLFDTFSDFFSRQNTFTLGVCNGCQMLSYLNQIIPGAENFPLWKTNQSQQFEARLSLVLIPKTASILMSNMSGSVMPVVVSHGEGRATIDSCKIQSQLDKEQHICLQYVDHRHRVTEQYPFNPNGSPAGTAGVTSADGRVTLMMPHPERGFRTSQNSWAPNTWGEHSPWIRLFENARAWLQ